MSEKRTCHRLDGLEPDNLLAFMALLGLMRSLDAADRTEPDSLKLRARASFEIDVPPVRPMLHLVRPLEQFEIAEKVNQGISMLSRVHEFGGRKKLDYGSADARRLLEESVGCAAAGTRDRADLLASLMSDAAIKDGKNLEAAPVDPTPLCLLFGQGHQFFLERLVTVPAELAPPPRGRGKKAIAVSAEDCIAEVLFAPWHRSDPTFSFRWDPEEDVRYALMAGNPTDAEYKTGTQHGANRLAAVGLAALTMVPETRAGRVRPNALGGFYKSGGFSFRWPIWIDPATLAAIRALLGHPEISKADSLSHLGVAYTLVARRISVGKFMNFTRGRVER